ncbi:uncharacterized protein BDZ99DRAFT_44039 [Mytilinidion resinicola]|uniref:Uncharacterized protein n=1 Tax=Mytilinidion resinicola TaxID=574789 RepID=A0A6A6YJL5_9PEZI|nr:uncharacterized protein BDZ99DRAFT_44039 [Mytilinidion resinicola]KAF2809042.1 hypothetical protein BDZ99DRAFT_44039 [Mytilinidion resinicola]
MWRSNFENPMTHMDSFHAPSWSWAAYKGPIIYSLGRGMEAGKSTSHCEISELAFDIENSCPHKCSKTSTTCVVGSVRWVGMIGTAIRSGTLSFLNLSNDKDLIEILGSPVHWEPRPPLRIVRSVAEEGPRKLSIPGRSEALKDEKGRIVGWVLLDTDGSVTAGPSFFCAAMRRWQRTTYADRSLGVVLGFDYRGEEILDILALKRRGENPRTYERIGIGRIVDKSWIRNCCRQTIEVW